MGALSQPQRGPVSIVRDPADPIAATTPVQLAIAQLQSALAAQGVATTLVPQIDQAASAPVVVLAGGDQPIAEAVLRRADAALPAAPESLALVPGRIDERPFVLATGRDGRGLAYAVLELADRVSYGGDPELALRIERPVVEQPANAIRSVARLFVSDVEDKPWFDDRSFWRRYLSNLVAHRFNRFHLALGMGHDFLRGVRDAYFLFPYPFLVTVPRHGVYVRGLPEAEREQNLATLRFIAQAAKDRGLHFQLGLWTHGYEWIDSPNPNYTIAGLTAENHAAYCRDALRTLLAECPAIDGLTIRVHGESGVPEGSYDFWRTVFDGIKGCGRPIEIDLHPKGVDREMIRVALATGLPVNLSPKYTAEHQGLPYQQASIREIERVSRPPEGDSFVSRLMNRSAGDLRYTRYGYADFLAEDRPYGVYFRVWPGTQRVLLWGDPALAAGFGRHASFSGCLGLDLCEPLSFKGRRGSGHAPRDPYQDESLRPAGGDWEKYLYTYRLFGRLLYNPDADPETWRRYLRHELGAAAPAAEAALASASRILPLVTTAHHPSAANNRYWPEMYTNLPIVDAARPHPYGDTPSPKRFGTVSALDPELFARIDDFADEIVRRERSGRYSPLRVAEWLDALAGDAEIGLDQAEALVADPAEPGFRRLAIDVRLQSGLGRFFAAKLRAGVGYALYLRTGELGRLRKALDHYRAARSAWIELAERASGVYRADLAIGGEPWLRGHWTDRLAAVDDDLADLEAEWRRATATGSGGNHTDVPLARLDPAPPATTVSHQPPAAFDPGRPVPIDLTVVDGSGTPAALAARLHYRPVNQAETYRVAEMVRVANEYRADVPAEETSSPYPLQYFFELRQGPDRAWFWPGLAPDLANQPYYVIQPRRTGDGDDAEGPGNGRQIGTEHRPQAG